MRSTLNDSKLEAFLDRLHAQSEAQNEEMNAYFARRVQEGSFDGTRFDDDMHRFLSDKMVALERDKAQFCYQLCRAIQAKRVVEAGTSYGVSTLYLAAAVRDNGAEDGVVIGTEYEPQKAEVARANFEEAGLDEYIELRKGDLRETLQNLVGPVDFLLLDIWEVALPALELVAPHLRRGAIVVCDNTTAFADHYRGYFEFIEERKDEFRTMTVPFEGGFELTIRL